jgi:hypothetical protein
MVRILGALIALVAAVPANVAAPTGGIDTFWLSGNLRISAEAQVAFLQRLYRNELPFRVERQRLVKDLMIVEAGRRMGETQRATASSLRQWARRLVPPSQTDRSG